MLIVLSILLIVGGVVNIIHTRNKAKSKILEMKYTQTSRISDALGIVDSMQATAPDYHHYVELKGMLNCDNAPTAPFTERKVAYYENQCSAVGEELRRERDSNGNMRTRRVRTENRLAEEKSSAPFYLKDDSCEMPVYIDAGSFVPSEMELQSGCDRMEQEHSQWMQRHNFCYSATCNGFLGYHLTERVLHLNQPVYVLGELYKRGEQYIIGKSVVDNKPSLLSYKSEDQILMETEKKQKGALLAGIGMIVAGVLLLWFSVS